MENMKTAKELIAEMDAEIEAETIKTVEKNKDEIQKFVEQKKQEVYEQCVDSIKKAVAEKYAVARKYLEQLVEKQEAATVAETPVAQEEIAPVQNNTEEAEKINANPVAPVEGPVTL